MHFLKRGKKTMPHQNQMKSTLVKYKLMYVEKKNLTFTYAEICFNLI